MKPVKYELLWDEEYRQGVYIEQRRGRDTTRWAIVGYNGILGKTASCNGVFFFEYEPRPSSRDDEFYIEYRWNSVEDAHQFWIDNRSNILATSREYSSFVMRSRLEEKS